MDMCRLVHFNGTVQGVGFRFTAREVAHRYAVTGYVRNLADGRVEMIVSGERKEILAYLEALRKSMGNYITDENGQWMEASEQFETFDIRF